MLILGEELVLVATATDPELMRGSQVLQLGLNAAGLAELAARGQIQLASPYDLPGDKIATEMLDHSLLRQIRDQIISAGDYHPQRIIRGLRAPTVHTYLERLREDGILDWDAPKNPKQRYGRLFINDSEAVGAARARLDRVANGGGASHDQRDLDFAAIVHAIGLGGLVYRGFRNRSRRDALAAAVAKERYALLVTRALPRRMDGRPLSDIDSSRDLRMAQDMMRAVSFDVHHSTGYDGSGQHH